MSSPIFTDLWFSTQTVESIREIIEENPEEMINQLIYQIYKENAPQENRDLSFRTLRALDLTSFNFPLRTLIEQAIHSMNHRDSQSSVDVDDLDLLRSSQEDNRETSDELDEEDPLDAVYQQLTEEYVEASDGNNIDDQMLLNNLLIDFARECNMEGIEMILSKGASIEAEDPVTKYTPLAWAAYHENDIIFEYLIHSGARIDVKVELIGALIEKWVIAGKYDQLRLLLKKDFYLGTEFLSGESFLDLILKHGLNVATLLNSMSEEWRLWQCSNFMTVPLENYSFVIPADFAIAFSVESILLHILNQKNLDFLKGNLLVCLAQFLSVDKTMMHSVTVLKKFKIDQQRDFFENLDSDLERNIVKDLFTKELNHFTIPRQQFEKHLRELGDFVRTLVEFKRGISPSVLLLFNQVSVSAIDASLLKKTLEQIEKCISEIHDFQIKKMVLWTKQSKYLSLWLDDDQFKNQRFEFNRFITEIFTIQSHLTTEKRRLNAACESFEEEEFGIQEKGEIVSNPLQYNTKIKVLHKTLEKRLGCMKEYIHENHEQLYSMFYSSFNDRVREINNLRRSSETSGVRDELLKLYKLELKTHLEKVFSEKKIKSQADIILK